MTEEEVSKLYARLALQYEAVLGTLISKHLIFEDFVPGIRKDFYDTYEEARNVYRLAGEVSGLDMEALCFTENDRLNITEYTQIAMLATEVAVLKVLESKGVRADITAGLSLGEYGALAAADVMDLRDLFYIIRKRGIFMQEEYPKGGAMTAVLGLGSDQVEAICSRTEGIVTIDKLRTWPGRSSLQARSGR